MFYNPSYNFFFFCRISFSHSSSRYDTAKLNGDIEADGEIFEDELYDTQWTNNSSDRVTLLPAIKHKKGKESKSNSKEPSLVWALSKSFGGTFMMGGLFKFLQDVLNFVGPQLLKYVIHTIIMTK